MKTFKKFNKVVQIVALVFSLAGSISSFGLGNIGEGIAWGCCAVWIANLLLTERTLAQTEELVEILKAENEKLQNERN